MTSYTTSISQFIYLKVGLFSDNKVEWLKALYKLLNYLSGMF